MKHLITNPVIRLALTLALVCGLTAVVEHDARANPSSPEANKKAVRDFVEIVKNGRKLDKLGDYFAADFVEHNQTVASFGPGVAGYKAFLGHLMTGFPDDKVQIQLLVAEGDLVSYRATEQGTHQGTFLKIPATHKHATWTEIQFFRFKDGKIVEHWVDVDIFSWFQQLGIIPAMG